MPSAAAVAVVVAHVIMMAAADNKGILKNEDYKGQT